jgi:hypothetical protein
MWCSFEYVRTNDHVQSAATAGSTTPLDLNAARLQHIVRRPGSSPADLSVGDRRPSSRPSSYRIARRAAIFFLE